MNLSQARKTALFLLFIAVFSGLTYVLTAGIEKAVDPVQLLPYDTAVLVDVKKPVKALNKIRKSKFGLQISAIEWQDVLHDTGVPDEDIKEFVRLSGELEKIITSPFFNELFSRRVLMGMIPAAAGSWSPSSEKIGIEQTMVFIARPQHRASLVDFFSEFFLSGLQYTSEQYKGREIKTFVYDDNLSFSSTITQGLVVVSFAPEVIKHCIDNSISNMMSGRSGLLDNRHYRLLKERAGGEEDQFVYIDIPNLQTMIENTIGTAVFPPSNSLYHRLISEKMQTLERLVFYRQTGAWTQEYEAVLQLNIEDQQGACTLFSQTLSCRDLLLQTLPENNVVHLWLNMFNARRVWHFLRTGHNIFTQSFAQHAETWVGHSTEHSVDELLSLFGHQISLNIMEMKSSGIFPMPKIALFIEVFDREKVQDVLQKLFSELPVRQTTTGGHEVFSIVLAGGVMQPSYTFHENFLVVADNRQQLENIFSNSKRPLLESPLFTMVDVGLTDPNNLVLYYRNAEMIDGLKELVRWYGSLLQLFDSKSEARNRVILERIVLPVLDGMKMYKVKTVRAYTEAGEIIIKSSQLPETDRE